ncbi:MAG: acyltransferase [Oscillospiraceae bacterium]|nr:acyltransferase [Oscillospiraceae bacterium]
MNGRLSNPAAPARDSALDALRILACLLVVANHTLGYALNTGAPGAELFYCLLFSLCKTGVTLFVMVSGILLLDREDGFRKTGRRILRVLVPLLAVSALLAWKDEGLAGLAPLRFLASFLRDPRRAPYWYLYALIGFYLLLPFLQKMTRGFRLADYAAFSGLFLLLPCALDILRVFCGLELSGAFSLSVLPRFVTVAVCGAFAARLPARRNGIALSLLLFLLGWFGSFASFYFPFLSSGSISYALDSWDLLPAVLMAGSLVCLFRASGVGGGLGERGKRALRELSGMTFGVYLLHPVFEHRVFLLPFVQAVYAHSVCLGVALFALTLVLVCAAVSFLLRRIPVVREYL